MPSNLTISINNAKFHAFHGVYKEEKKTGNEFVVDLSVTITPTDTITGIAETVNYVALHKLLTREMQNPRELLETLLMELATIIHTEFRSVKKVEIRITKQAPIEKLSGSVGVSYSKEF
jgi:7,8-dihydroneopterin aldolase/epimerase/oxygenase